MDQALDVLRRVFGFPAFRGRQAEIVDHLCNGGDALVLMPTGGGKSLCFQLPALLRPGCGIVVSPLIALMQDQVDALLQLDVKAAFLNSSLDAAGASATERRLLAGDLDLLYVAPERLLSDRFLRLLDQLSAQGRIALFAIDEAHCVSQWGHDFRPEYIQLSILHERYPQVPRIALTATADSLTREEIRLRLGLGEAQAFVDSFDRPNIRYTVVDRDNARGQLADFLAGHRFDAGIVYCLSRKKVDETAAWLQGQGITALPYHAGLDADTRRAHQQRFVRDDGIVMVATIAFGMGIDKPDVRFVAHLDLPKSLEAYYQETGRAGRDGEPAEAWMTYGINDVVIHSQRIDESAAPDTQKRIERQKLDAMLAYCETAGCRRSLLLRYFGEGPSQAEMRPPVGGSEHSERGGPLLFGETHAACGNCDTCINPPELWDGTEAARKFMSAALRTGQRFGAAHLIDILRGKSTAKVAQFGHEALPTFGIGSDLDDAAWRNVARQLLAGGLLHANAHQYGALQLTDTARPVLKGESTLMLRRPLARRKAAVRRPSPSSLPPHASAENAGMFETLRQWRATAARDQGVPAYVILHDRTLHELASQRPRTLDELLAVPGIGAAKAERYGTALLAALQEDFAENREIAAAAATSTEG